MRSVTHPLHDLPWMLRVASVHRQLIALGGGAVTVLLLALARDTEWFKMPREVPWMLGWLVYAGILLTFMLGPTWRFDSSATRHRAQWNDPGVRTMKAVVLVAACASLLAVALVVDSSRALHGLARWVSLGLALLSLASAWLLIQTTYALHYARAFYRGAGEGLQRGLDFPHTPEPAYIDFCYFAAVVGMTSQTADVAITTPAMRRLVLGHGLIAFAFNLTVLALAVNAVASSFG